MPLSFCENHGVSSGLEMCEHLFKGLEQGIYLNYYELPVYKIRMCKQCYEKHEVQTLVDSAQIDKQAINDKKNQEKGINVIAPDHYFEEVILQERHPKIIEKIKHIYGTLNEHSSIECIDCIYDVQLSHARKNNLTLPFEPFENTISHSDDERISRLEELLQAQVDIKGKHLEESTATYEMTRSVTVWSGSVKKPLTINIYGFSEEEDQKKLLQLIEDFFKDISEKQRKIIFYESLNWIHTALEKGMKRRTRDTDKVISEIIVRE